jgi:hypothetical protein
LFRTKPIAVGGQLVDHGIENSQGYISTTKMFFEILNARIYIRKLPLKKIMSSIQTEKDKVK